MSQTDSKNWTLRSEHNYTLIVYHGEIAPDEGKAIVDKWTPMISDDDIDTHVLVLDADGHFDDETFGTIEQAGQLGLEHDVDRWAIVGRKTKTMAITSKLPDAIETFDSSDRDEALDWARQ